MKWNISLAAEEFGVSRETVRRGLAQNGVRTHDLKEFSTAQIVAALFGDMKAERLKRERLENAKLERENAVAEGRLHSEEYIWEKVWQDFLAPLRSELLNLHTTVGPRCTSAEESMPLIKAWVESTLAKLKPAKPPEQPAALQS